MLAAASLTAPAATSFATTSRAAGSPFTRPSPTVDSTSCPASCTFVRVSRFASSIATERSAK